MSGSDWLLGDVGKKKPEAKPNGEGIPISKGEVDAVLADFQGVGKKLHTGIGAASERLKAIGELGLTRELLVLLVVDKAPFPRGAKHRLNAAQVEAALKGLFSIGEYLR